MAEQRGTHVAEVERLKEEGIRKGLEASLASDRREKELRQVRPANRIRLCMCRHSRFQEDYFMYKHLRQ